MTDLADRTCEACSADTPKLSHDKAHEMMAQLSGWKLNEDASELSRRLEFKGFAKALQVANAVGFLCERTGHHADISFGWGYCEIRYSTHAIGGLSEADFISAAKVDRLLEL